MPYEPPRGWVEDVGDEAEELSGRLRFHTTDRCKLIKDPTRLRAVDKPYSATRCSACATP